MGYWSRFLRAIPLYRVGCIRVTHPFATLEALLLKLLPFDLHVLGLPLAFILSQDQTLHCKLLYTLFWLGTPKSPNLLFLSFSGYYFFALHHFKELTSRSFSRACWKTAFKASSSLIFYFLLPVPSELGCKGNWKFFPSNRLLKKIFETFRSPQISINP